MRDYLNSNEKNQFMVLQSTVQMMDDLRNSGVNGPKISSMLEDWTKRDNMTNVATQIEGRKTMSDNNKGIYDKYTVINNETQKPIDGAAFILRPDRDPFAIAALQRYAELTDNELLAHDITGWLEALEFTGSDMPPECDYCESVAKVKSSPFMADVGASMCKQCWDDTRKEYVASHGEDIGDF